MLYSHPPVSPTTVYVVSVIFSDSNPSHTTVYAAAFSILKPLHDTVILVSVSEIFLTSIFSADISIKSPLLSSSEYPKPKFSISLSPITFIGDTDAAIVAANAAAIIFLLSIISFLSV